MAHTHEVMDTLEEAHGHMREAEAVQRTYNHVLAPEELRRIRSIEILEHVGTREARELLAALAKGAPQARLTREAKESLERMGKRLAYDP